MTEPDPRTSRNSLLSGLSGRGLGFLAPHLEPVELRLREVIEPSGEPVEQVYFPAAGLGSVLAIGPDGEAAEGGLFGRDGMSGHPVVMGGDRSPHETRIQLAGTGHRIAADALREARAAEPAIRERFLAFIQAFVVQVSHTALANARHTMEDRLARWLLMCQDRTEGEVLELTHEVLSIMMGVRRAGVTVATHELERRGLIKAASRRIRILDRGGLEARARGLYGVPEAEYARLLDGKGAERVA